jgi:hypothetical protein
MGVYVRVFVKLFLKNIKCFLGEKCKDFLDESN